LNNKITAIVISLLGFVFGIALGLYLNLFVATSATTANDITKSLIDANIGLLGLLGVIAVYVLTSYQSFERMIEERIDRIHSEHNMKTDLSKKLPEYFRNIPSEGVEAEYKQYTDAVKKWENRFNKLQADSQDAVRKFVLSAIAFLASIMLSLGGMGTINDKIRSAFIYFSGFAFVMGVVLIVGMIYGLRTNLQLSSHEKGK
jgi:hypothetical protein